MQTVLYISPMELGDELQVRLEGGNQDDHGYCPM